MEPLTAVILILSFFLLRFALPLLCTIGVCRLLNRWQASWTKQPA